MGVKGLVLRSWDLVSQVINKVTILIRTYNLVKVLITLLTMSHDPPSTGALSSLERISKAHKRTGHEARR